MDKNSDSNILALNSIQKIKMAMINIAVIVSCLGEDKE